MGIDTGRRENTILQRWLPQALIATAILAPAPARSVDCVATSLPAIMPVIELFTSEGCSSCPPADRWLSALREGAAPGHPITALAYHVDYWDDIGWKDRFARPIHGEIHQERVAAAVRPIRYTPQVFVDGEEFSDWRRGTHPDSRGPAAISIHLAMNRTLARRWRFTLAFSGELERATTVTLALVEHDLQSLVSAGENAGSRLTHDFVVRDVVSEPFDGKSAEIVREMTLPDDSDPLHSQVTIVLRDAQHRTVQSLTAPLCGA